MIQEPIIRFEEVCKIFKHGAAVRSSALEDEDETDLLLDEEEAEQPAMVADEPRMALQNITLSIMPGDRVGVIGGNGSGKSTLLNLIAGLSPPTSGRLIGRGSVVPLNSVKRPFSPNWSGLRNLKVLARLLGFPEELIEEHSQEIAAFAGMKEALMRPICSYSSGMYARLAFSAVLALDAEIYILDDKVGVGDAAYQEKCWRRLVEICEGGKTLILATHKFRLVQELCTRAIWLDQGSVKADGLPNEIAALYHARLLESPDANAPTGEEGKQDGEEAQERATNEPLLVLEGDPSSLEATPIGIFDLDCLVQGKSTRQINSNETATLRVRLRSQLEDVSVDVMVEVYCRKVLIYQSFPPKPIQLNGPQELTFEVSIDGEALPDNQYTFKVRVLYVAGAARMISAGSLAVTTSNCRPGQHGRAQLFVKTGAEARVPLGQLAFQWTLRGETALLVPADEENSLAFERQA